METVRRNTKGQFWSEQANARRSWLSMRNQRGYVARRIPVLFPMTVTEELGAMQRILGSMLKQTNGEHL